MIEDVKRLRPECEADSLCAQGERLHHGWIDMDIAGSADAVSLHIAIRTWRVRLKRILIQLPVYKQWRVSGVPVGLVQAQPRLRVISRIYDAVGLSGIGYDKTAHHP